MNPKSPIRKKFKKIRSQLSTKRKEEASKAALQALLALEEKYPYILSFASKENEIDLWPFNLILAEKKKLLLSRVLKEHLVPFLVQDFEKELSVNPDFQILEPNPTLCKQLPINKISCILVPGLAFDKNIHRLGYGLGYYDRFLMSLVHYQKIGIGFKEQLYEQRLPIEEFDISLDDVLLF